MREDALVSYKQRPLIKVKVYGVLKDQKIIFSFNEKLKEQPSVTVNCVLLS